MDHMCRSIKTLRPPYVEVVEDGDVQAAALQYVRKVAGMRTPTARNAAAFDEAVRVVTAATTALLGGIEVRPVTGALTPAERQERARASRR